MSCEPGARSTTSLWSCGWLALAIAALLVPASSSGAATIGYWRMETDLDLSPGGLRVANEFAPGNDLISSEAFVDTLNNPNGTVPQTGSTNIGSVGATVQGGANGINGSVDWYSQLDVSSITIEFWSRTNENQATLFSRSSGGADGITLANPSSLDLTYHVDDGAGGSIAFSLLNMYDMDAIWRHYVFQYDETNGEASFYVNNNLVASYDGPDNRALVWGTNVDLLIGTRMDFAGAFNGTLDEFRIDSTAIPRDQLLYTPEPGSAPLLALGLALLASRRRREPR